jgi:putative oxidoreductase
MATTTRQNLALGILRVAAGVVFFAHGWQKLVVYGVPGVQAAFERMGAPLPYLTGPLFGVVELVGGLLLVAGLFSRLAGLALALDALGALLVVHAPSGFFLPQGIEFVLTLFAATLAIALMGGGAYSLDAALAQRRRRAKGLC